MKDAQSKFYTSVAKYYSMIFPYNNAQLKFVGQQLNGIENKKILDVGCATGELSYHLANAGARVVGIDLNEDLLHQAASDKKHPNLSFMKMNMLDLNHFFTSQQFDAVLCFGNTLVHLDSLTQVEEMLSGVRTILKDGGKFLLQILHYDYIIENKIEELPVIENDQIRFIRNYTFQENSPAIKFRTLLQVKEDDFAIENETILLALKKQDLNDALNKAGFKNVRMYANFNSEKSGGKHIPLVVTAE